MLTACCNFRNILQLLLHVFILKVLFEVLQQFNDALDVFWVEYELHFFPSAQRIVLFLACSHENQRKDAKALSNKVKCSNALGLISDLLY